MSDQDLALVWFRHDLRLCDNLALIEAADNHKFILPCFILPKSDSRLTVAGSAQLWWLKHSLAELNKQLNKLGSELVLLQGEPKTVLPKLFKQVKPKAIYLNQQFEPAFDEFDAMLQQRCERQEIAFHSYNSRLLQYPGEVLNQQGGPFKVYTPYWRAARKELNERQATPTPKKLVHFNQAGVDISSDGEIEPAFWSDKFDGLWQPGEHGALKRLEAFIDENLQDYASKRDQIDCSVTSELAAHIHFGEISVWTIWQQIHQARKKHPKLDSTADKFLAQLGWREFSYYLLHHFPDLRENNFNDKFNDFPWSDDKKALKRWQQGLTGFPIVDAGMQELWQTGYMHNRVRMIVASFLTKDLLIDWRLGASWFEDCLLDADLANNTASWQWVAGSGADAAPYFRIFNPILQSKKFDKDGEYIARWLPQLAKLPAKFRHEPWLMSTEEQKEFSVVLGKDYPKAMLDHAKARELALDHYQQYVKN